jgi:predicted PurR-regulated permease PerM
MPKDTRFSPTFAFLAGGASVVILVAGLKLAASIVNLVLISFLLAFSISPIQNWLIKKRLPKGLAVALTVLLILIGGSGLVSILAVSVAGLIGKLPVYEARLTSLWNSINAFFISHSIDISGLLSLKEFDPKQVVGVAGKLLGTILQGMSNSLFVVIIMVFVLIELADLQSRNFRGKAARTGFQDRVNQTVGDVAKYISITGWNGLINAVANFFWLLVLGVDFALTWAVISFFFNFIPNIGIVMAVIPPAAIALLEYGWVRMLLVVIGYVVLNFIAENVIKPRTMKARLDISPLLTILSVIFWSWVLGPLGTILAIPLTITLQKLVKEQMGQGSAA